MKNLKKFLALALSASMALGMSMTSMAAEPEVSVDAPIYAYDITNVVVPTSYVVAFNPNGLDVVKNGDTDNPIRDQIVSKNYGIINKSTQDKVITVTLKVEDLNEGKITFAETAQAVTDAAADDYVVNLTLVPADDTAADPGTKAGILVDGADGNLKVADLETTGANLANVTMTGATSKAQVLVAGENDVDFLLKKADYTGSIDLDAVKDNNVSGNFTLSSLATGNGGITAFTFGGTMNAKADWTKLTKGIRITAVYSNENAPSSATAESGTSALFVNPNPTFKTGAEVGTIKYKAGASDDDKLASITKVEMEWNGKAYDGYNSGGKYWAAATDSDGLITMAAAYIKTNADANPDDIMRPATITYVTAKGETKTATVNVRVREYNGASFTTGSEVGTINYVSGTSATDALASITKIEMEWGGKTYDGYNSGGKYWAAATDSDGVVTLAAAYISTCAGSYTTDTTRPATITYVTTGGEEKTATVNVKIR